MYGSTYTVRLKLGRRSVDVALALDSLLLAYTFSVSFERHKL